MGVAVLPDGRVFGDFPRWDYNPVNPVEIGADGSVKPYPDANWCTWNETVRNEPQKHWICPQSVYADLKTGMLWVLDPASPGLKGTVVGGPKLVRIDPKTNTVVQNISFPESVAARKSYLNDVRVDTERNVAYITESGIGALVVVDLKSGKVNS